MSRAWLTSLVRARQVQEDQAKEQLAHARRHARNAELRAQADDHRVRAMRAENPSGTALAFIAAASARQAAAATLSAARQTQAFADEQVAARASSLTTAAQHRLSAEKLAERDEVERRRAEGVALQLELDEIGARMRRSHDVAADA
jgi:flagellar biosynthesis chaperone FliJ